MGNRVCVVESLEERLYLSGSTTELAVLENVQITDDPRVQQRPIVAVNPLNSDHVVIAYNDAAHQRQVDAEFGDRVGISVSFDGGSIWQQSEFPLPSGFDDFGFHPTVEFDDQGRLFVAFSAGRINPGSEIPPRFISDRPTEEEFVKRVSRDRGLFAARSDDGGLSWNEPVAIAAEVFDGEDLVFLERDADLAFDSFALLPDGSSNPNYGNLYVTWTRFYPRGEFPGSADGAGSDAMLAVSRDGGLTWETQLEEREFFDDANGDGVRQDTEVTTSLVSVLRDPLNGGNTFGFGNFGFGQIDVGPEGDVYVTDLGVETFTVFHSTDGGASFAWPDRGNELRVPFGPGLFADPGQVSWPDNALISDTTRQIVADPVRPGHVYVVEAITVRGPGGVIDLADVFFARSTDHGATWETNFTGNGAGGVADLPLNDDNGGQSATGEDPNEIITGQAFPILAADEAGNLAVIWYDTRRDPNDVRLFDVFGTVSTDGGITFSPNFRITNESFDFLAGKPELDAAVAFRYHGLAIANNTAYVAWADTRTGNQDIFFARFAIQPAPEALSDRFEPNDLIQTATDLGRVVQRNLPALGLAGGDEDWFLLETAAGGELNVTAMLTGGTTPPPNGLTVELYDATGTTLLATSTDALDEFGNVIGRNAHIAATAGENFLVRVRSDETTFLSYSLELLALTADLGTRAFVTVDGNIAAGGGALYRVAAPATGSLAVQLTGGDNVVGSLDVQILDPQTLAVLANGAPPEFVPVNVASVEPNDSPPDANPTDLPANGAVVIDGTIEQGDFDFYSIVAGANQKLTLDIDAEVLGSALDSAVAILNSSGDIVAFNLDADGSRDSFVEFVTPEAGVYFLLVTTRENFVGTPSSTGAYTATITSVALGSGEIEQAGRFVQQGETLLVLVTGADETSSGDFTLELSNLDQFATPDLETLLVPSGVSAFDGNVGDLNDDGNPDIIVLDHSLEFISVLLGAGNGTFQPSRQFDVGAAVPFFNPFKLRRSVITDVSGDGIPDILVNNPGSSDISVLLGRGDGTFETQRRFDAVSGVEGFAVADLNGDGLPDIVAGESAFGKNLEVAVLFGRGDGTFLPARIFETTLRGGAISTIEVADFNGDGAPDLLLVGGFGGSEIRLGNGDGTFGLPTSISSGDVFDAQVIDLDGDGNLDLALPTIGGRVAVHLGNGDGTFSDAQNFAAGDAPTTADIVDFASQVILPDGSIALGPPDGRLDIVVSASGITDRGDSEVLILPGIFEFDDEGNFVLFGPPLRIVDAEFPLRVRAADLDGDGSQDLVVTDLPQGVLLIFGEPPQIEPNTTQATAIDLGTVVHVLEPARTIVPSFDDAWFQLTVPTEAVGGGDEVLDFSALFEGTDTLGLQMEVVDADGNLLGSGERFRIAAPQGAELFVHIFGVEGDDTGETPVPPGSVPRGSGAYTLIIDVLPQVVSMEAESLLPGVDGRPGGPINSITVILQGDRLDQQSAENPNNYRITFVGDDGQFGTADDQLIPIGGANIEQPIVYNASANIDVSSGQTFATAIRQTVTLVFAEALPVGSYVIEISPGIQAQLFNGNEPDLLTDVEGFTGHALVTLSVGQITEGVRIEAENLIRTPGNLGDLSAFEDGTRFLTQLQNDLQTLLDSILSELGDAESVTDSLLDQILARLSVALGEFGQRQTSLLVLVLDPVSFSLDNRFKGGVASYNLQTNTVTNDNPNTFLEVGGNVEIVIVADAEGTYDLDIADVPATARGGALILGNVSNEVINFTDRIRAGETSLSFIISAEQAVVSRPQPIVNRSVTDDSQVQQQPTIAVNPLDPDHVVIAYHDESLAPGPGRFGIGISVSRDGGRTFSKSSVALPEALDETTGAGLPVVQFNADGGLYLFFDALNSAGAGFSLAAFGNFAIGAGVFLAHSEDGGMTWSVPAPIEFDVFTGTQVSGIIGNDFAIDRSLFLPDGTVNPHFGNFYASWEIFHPDRAGGVRFAVSQDRGVTWDIQDLVTPESADFDTPGLSVLGRSRITTGPDGTVYVSSFSAGKFRVLRSTDGGTSFVTSEDRLDTRFAPFALESTGTPQNIGPEQGGWADNRFRADSTRAIVADPTRPGNVYVADADADFIDRQAAFADIVLARSIDFGETYTEVGIAGSGFGLDLPLNDDNNGRLPSSFSEVIAAQAFPSLAVDNAGNLLVVWYDTRTDPDNFGIDVFATLSTDGGQTFSPNFRITEESIDLDAGLYTNLIGLEDVNFIGRGEGIAPPVVTLSNGKAFVAWTDTRGGSQDIFFAGFTVNPVPAAFNDRFEINDTPDEATDLRRVVQRQLPSLVVTGGDEDWFRVEAAASGNLIAGVFFSGETPPSVGDVTLELRDETGQMLSTSSLIILDGAGNLIGLQVSTPTAVGDTLFVRVNGENIAVGEQVTYNLGIQSLTADLGSPAFRTVEGNITSEGAALFKYTAAAAGALELELNPGRFDLQILDAETFEVLATGHLGELFPSQENNDTIFTPNVLDLDGIGTVTIEGFIGDGDFADIGDSDFYSVDLQAGQQLILDVNADSLGSLLNPVVVLFGLTTGPQGIFFEDGLTNDPFVVFEAPSADTYVFAIVDNAGGPPNLFSPGTLGGAGATGSYEIVVSTSPAVAAVQGIENNDTIFTPQPLDLGEFGTVTVDGFIGDGDFADIGDKDFYSVFLEAGEQLVIHVDPTTPIELATRLFGFNSGVDSGFIFDDGLPESPLAIFEAPVSDTYVFMIVEAGGGFPFITEPGRDGDPGATGPYRFTVLTPHATAPVQTSVPVLQGEQVLIQVTSQGGSQGDFSLDVTNRDLFSDVSPDEILISAGEFLDRIKTADLNQDGHPDIVSVAFSSTFVQVILGNGDGTFQAPRQFAIGAARDHELAIADVTGDGIPDIIVTNFASADVSVLIGRGDGTFETQRRFDATATPTTVATADFDNDGVLDLAVGSFSFENDTRFATLLGRGDGTFLPQSVFQREDLQTFSFSLAAGDVNGDGFADVVDFGGRGEVVISLGNGDGTFNPGPVISMAIALAGEGILADLDSDGNLDLLQVEQNTGELFVRLGNGDATFGDLQAFEAGAVPGGISVVDFGSPVFLPDGSIALGPPDGKLDVIVVAIGNAEAEAEIVLLPGIFDSDEDGNFVLLGDAIQITSEVVVPVDPDVADFNSDGFVDVAVAENRGILVRFGAPPVILPNTTLETARDLGTVVHVVQPTRTIVPGFEDAWFQFTVPTEAVSGNDEILDFSALFAGTDSIGLRMEVLDASGNALGRGERFRVTVAQGSELFVHVFGGVDIIGNRGTGAYTLTIDVLPQVVSVEAESLLPGGPVNTITIVLQGDRLDPLSAEDPANYTVTFVGPDEVFGTPDDQVFAIGGSDIMQPVVYNSSGNLDVSSGQTFATAIRQTVTLLFAEPLPSGSYEIELSENIQTQSFSNNEFDLLADRETFGEHPVVFFDGNEITNGSRITIENLVPASGTVGDFSVFEEGTRFLTQLQNDLGTLLDSILSEIGDDSSVTGLILDQLAARILPGLGELNDRLTQMLVIFLDPIPFGLVDPGGNRTVFDLQTNTIVNNIGNAFVEVGGNVELLIIPNAQGTFTLDVAGLPATPRLGALLFGSGGDQVLDLTAQVRSGTNSFSFTFDQTDVLSQTPQTPSGTSTSTNLLNFSNQVQLNSADLDIGAASLLRTSFVLDDFIITRQLIDYLTSRNSLRDLFESQRDSSSFQFNNWEQFREWFEDATQFLRERLEMLRESLDKIIPGEEGDEQKEKDTKDGDEQDENELDQALLDLFWNGLTLSLKGSHGELHHLGETLFLPAPTQSMHHAGSESPKSTGDRPNNHPDSALETKHENPRATSSKFNSPQKPTERISARKTKTELGNAPFDRHKDAENDRDQPSRLQSKLKSTAVEVALKSLAYILKW